MNTPQAQHDPIRASVIPTRRPGLPTAAWVAGGAMLVVIAGLAATLLMRSAPEQPAAGAAELGSAAPAAKPVSKRPAQNSNTGGGGDDGSSSSGNTGTRVAAAPACASCGVVESVREIQVKGAGTGLGAVAGSVLGGVVGHQMGGGDGKKALTVLGAVGGGVAGHEVEKRARASTSYEVRVRMADGTTRTVTSSQALKAGDRVTVDGNSLRLANG